MQKYSCTQVFIKKDSSNSWGDRATKTENQRIFGDFDAFWIVIDLYDFNTVKEVGRDDLDMETQAVTWQSRLQTDVQWFGGDTISIVTLVNISEFKEICFYRNRNSECSNALLKYYCTDSLWLVLAPHILFVAKVSSYLFIAGSIVLRMCLCFAWKAWSASSFWDARKITEAKNTRMIHGAQHTTCTIFVNKELWDRLLL